MGDRRHSFRVNPQYQPILRQVGLDADAVFTHAGIRVWRSLPDRENCTLDAALADGSSIRLHIKRYRGRGAARAAEREQQGISALERAAIPTVPLVGWGSVDDGRGFTITLDLEDHRSIDRLVRDGTSFDDYCEPVADLVARLHEAELHHRDLYLCHFFTRVPAEGAEVRLIDAARVRRLPPWPLRRRWIVKDLAQLWYSTLGLDGVMEPQRLDLLRRYAAKRNIPNVGRLRRQVERKARAIARHDARLNERQPNRNISIPQSAATRGN